MKKLYKFTTPASQAVYAGDTGLKAMFMQHLIMPILMLFGFNPAHIFVNSKETFHYRSFSISKVLIDRESPYFKPFKHWRDEGVITLKDCNYDYSLMSQVVVAATMIDDAIRQGIVAVVDETLFVHLYQPNTSTSFAYDYQQLAATYAVADKPATILDDLDISDSRSDHEFAKNAMSSKNAFGGKILTHRNFDANAR